jgi:hypothetical protein
MGKDLDHHDPRPYLKTTRASQRTLQSMRMMSKVSYSCRAGAGLQQDVAEHTYDCVDTPASGVHRSRTLLGVKQSDEGSDVAMWRRRMARNLKEVGMTTV